MVPCVSLLLLVPLKTDQAERPATAPQTRERSMRYLQAPLPYAMRPAPLGCEAGKGLWLDLRPVYTSQ